MSFEHKNYAALKKRQIMIFDISTYFYMFLYIEYTLRDYIKGIFR